MKIIYKIYFEYIIFYLIIKIKMTYLLLGMIKYYEKIELRV
ncbi:hypothetical protein HMPREF1039_0514 [Megasphaera lornae]|uniref:Uncharacterized protein n=1 Tax=Megasphaera lornae TaxID=1000568 RepID=A0ABN0XLD9_9FIRM|nr:hypothetical protein HMPREF1039_0514 [Megasphaera lornae]